MSWRLSDGAQRLAAVAGVLALIVVATVAWVNLRGSDNGDIADEAVISVSSLARGSIIRQVTNSQDNGNVNRGWRSSAQTTGAWIQFSWSAPHQLRRISIERNPLDQPGATDGYLVFGNGSQLQVRLSTTDRTTTVPFTPRSAQTLRFVVSGVSTGATSVSLSRVRIYNTSHTGDVATGGSPDGDSARDATVSATGAPPTNLDRLVDGNRATASTLPSPVGTTITLQWKRPRELKTVTIAGSHSPALLSSGKLTFSDGSTLPVGAVDAGADHPTTVSFMPIVTSVLRLTVDTTSGHGALGLAEISADQLDAPPRVPARAAAGPPNYPAPPTCPVTPPQPSAHVGIVAECPVDGAGVDDTATLTLSVAAGYASVRTQVAPSSATTATPPPIDLTPAPDGTLSVPLDLRALPAGPFAVLLTATGPGQTTTTVTLHLDKQTGTALPTASALASHNGPAEGRSLVFDDEFTQKPDIGQLGDNADYAFGKPGPVEVQGFGDAIFAPPAVGLGNARVVDNDYLKLAAEPRPASYTDPSGYGRDYIGALMSSAGIGGTGFSAQFGYFEARMLAPAASGTWPAFWTLPTTSTLADPPPEVAEIDAVELHGAVPDASCSTTHQYVGTRDGGVARCATRWTGDEQARWHTYGVSIEPTVVRFYIDGKLVATAPQVRGGSAPMFFLLDLALGGGWPVNLASTNGLASLYIDYVRVYV